MRLNPELLTARGVILPSLVLALMNIPVAGQAVLEDFTSVRYRIGTSRPLWDHVTVSVCPSLSWQVVNREGVVSVTSGSCPYIHFMPYPYDWSDGFTRSYLKSGSWDPLFNRMLFRFKCGATWSNNNGTVGTYVKSQNAPGGSNQGAHYYHPIGKSYPVAGRWEHQMITWKPSHQASHSPGVNWPADVSNVWPTGDKFHYFDGLTRFYYSWEHITLPATTCSFDDVTFVRAENEPDEWVSSLNIIYDGTKYQADLFTREFEIDSFHIRYSPQSLKSVGFSNGVDASSGQRKDLGDWFHWDSPAMPEQRALYVGFRPVAKLLGVTNSSPIKIITDTPLNVSAGDEVAVVGVGGNTAANGRWPVTPVPRAFWTVDDGTLVSVVSSSGVTTVTTSAAHNLLPGMYVSIYWYGNIGPFYWVAPRKISATPTSNTLTLSIPDLADGTFSLSSNSGLTMWSSPMLILNGSTSNGTYTSGGTVSATAEFKNFTEIVIPRIGTTSSPCDIDSNGSLNEMDVQLITNIALGIQAGNADLDGDGRTTVVDVQRIINAVLGQGCKTGP
jgi:hypothetical protein